MNRESLLRLAIKNYGQEAQQLMAVEECSELIKAICKLSRGGNNYDVAEEIADVQIMIDQLKIIFSDCGIEGIEEKKLARLEQRIKTHNAEGRRNDEKN